MRIEAGKKEIQTVKRDLVSRHFAIIGVTLLVLASPLQAGYVYWTNCDNNSIERANIEIVDSEEKISTLLPHIDQMVAEGLITLEKVHVIKYSANGGDAKA